MEKIGWNSSQRYSQNIQKAKDKEVKVIVVWPNEILMKQDANSWNEVEKHFERTGAVLKRVAGIEAAESETNKDAIILVDEAD